MILSMDRAAIHDTINKVARCFHLCLKEVSEQPHIRTIEETINAWPMQSYIAIYK